MSLQTLAQFIAKWTNVYCDFDGYYGGQCVDLADFYLRDVWGVPVFFVTGAVDLFGHRPDLIEWIANDVGNANQYPKPGDMVIWHLDAKIGTGVNGHVDIFVSGGGVTFTGFDENWPVGSTPHLQTHNYEGVKGWGRRRSVTPPIPPVVVPPVVVPPVPDPIAFYSFHPDPVDDLHPADQATTLSGAKKLADEYATTHVYSVIEVRAQDGTVVYTAGPIKKT